MKARQGRLALPHTRLHLKALRRRKLWRCTPSENHTLGTRFGGRLATRSGPSACLTRSPRRRGRGGSLYVLANGSTLRSPRFNIREMRVGNHVVRNVAASVGRRLAPHLGLVTDSCLLRISGTRCYKFMLLAGFTTAIYLFRGEVSISVEPFEHLLSEVGPQLGSNSSRGAVP